MPNIHKMAVVDPKAELADDVEIGPFCVVGPNVRIDAGTRLISNVNVLGHTTLGKNNTVFPYVSIGTDPQDYDYKGGVSYVKIGDGNRFREGVTVNLGTKEGSATVIGNNCYFMANSHVAHNANVGRNVIMVQGAMLGGYVTVMDNAILSGLTAVHQFCRVGRFAFLGGGSTISMDLPPFMLADGRNGVVRGVNVIGLRRNGFSNEDIKTVKRLYTIFFRSDLNGSQATARIQEELPDCAPVMEFLEFVQASGRGVLMGKAESRRD